MRKILLASNNLGKVDRFRKLIRESGLDVEIVTPLDCGLEVIDVVENGTTLADNAELKARSYLGKIDIPILSNDTGFWLETEGFVDAPKRYALGNDKEDTLSPEEISTRMSDFWKSKATAAGGQVDAAWVEVFFLLNPDGTFKVSHCRREVVLTDKEFGVPPLQLPVRALYISKTTNKPAILHTREEELEEMLPVTNAIKELLS